MDTGGLILEQQREGRQGILLEGVAAGFFVLPRADGACAPEASGTPPFDRRIEGWGQCIEGWAD